MDLLAELEDAIGGPGTFDRDVYEAEALRAMAVVEKWLREHGSHESPDILADELAEMRKGK